MIRFSNCKSFANIRPEKLFTRASLDNEVYLSLNIPLVNLTNLLSAVNSFVKSLHIRPKDKKIYIYPQESIHFSILALSSLSSHNNVSDIELIIGERVSQIEKIVREEASKLKIFNVAIKFVNRTPKSAFFALSTEINRQNEICKFQTRSFDRVSKLIKDLGLNIKLDYKNKMDCFAANFLRWETENVSDVKDVIEKIENEFEENIKNNLEIEDKVKGGILTYSNQFWGPEPIGRKDISEIKFS